MVSSSKSAQSTNSTTEDNRIIADAGGIAVNSRGGAVQVQFVADEAFELAEMSVGEVSETSRKAMDIVAQSSRDTLNKTLNSFTDTIQRTQTAARSETSQLAEQVLKIGVPAAVVIFLVTKMGK